jgi:predicted dinucleotide-binding enzyme
VTGSQSPNHDAVAIVGATGALGFALTVRWGAAGVPVVLGSRDTAGAIRPDQLVRPSHARHKTHAGLKVTGV